MSENPPAAPASDFVPGAYAVSVVIPAYNAAACLGRAIGSVLSQSQPAAEIVVVDDGSTDSTAALAESFGAAVRLVRQHHQGVAAARNAGIQAARAPWIAFLDADDEWLPEKLARQMALHRTRDLIFSYCRSNEIGPDGTDRGDTFADSRPRRGAEAWRYLLAANFVATPTVVASRALLLALGGFDARLKVGEDQDMWIRLALAGPIDFVDRSLVRVHVRPDGLSALRLDDELDYTWPMIARHVKKLAPRLHPGEVRFIRGERLGRIGRTAYAHGRIETGAGLILHAIALRNRPLRNAYHLAAQAPPARWLRRQWERNPLSGAPD